MTVIDYLIFTEGYHYALLFLWLVMLAIGVKYFRLLEFYFKPKIGFDAGESYGQKTLIVSFALGFLMFLFGMFKPFQGVINYDYVEYIFYGLFILLLALNVIVSISNYISKSGIIRVVTMSALMLLYFYSGMLGGLMVVAIFVLFIIIYALLRSKKTLTIR